MHDYSAKPKDKSATNPIYIVVIKDPFTDSKIFIKSRSDCMNVSTSHIIVKGVFLTEKKAKELMKKEQIEEKDRELDGRAVQYEVPIHQWIMSQNITFNGFANRRK